MGNNPYDHVVTASEAGVLPEAVRKRFASAEQGLWASTAMQPDDVLTDDGTVVLGDGAESDGIQAVVVGDGARSTSEKSVAVGRSARTGWRGVAIGEGSEAATQAVAVGRKAEAAGGGVAIGYGAVADDGEVSFGNSSQQRRVTNIADGEAPTDAATVGQMCVLKSPDGSKWQIVVDDDGHLSALKV